MIVNCGISESSHVSSLKSKEKLTSSKSVAGSSLKLCSIPKRVLVRLGIGCKRRGEMKVWLCTKLPHMRESLHVNLSFVAWVHLVQNKRQSFLCQVWYLRS